MNFREIADFVISSSKADETEVLAMEQDESLTRFANNCIHQNVNERNLQITVRSVIGTKIGIAVANDSSPDSLHQLTTRAYDLARLQPDNPEFKGLPAPQPTNAVSAFDIDVATCSPEGRATRVAVICRKAAGAGSVAAGSLTTASLSVGVANSKGIFAEHRATTADLSTVLMGRNSSCWGKRRGWGLNSIGDESIADEALAGVGARSVTMAF